MNKGSTWIKCDLHVHSPESSGYKGCWDEFKKQIIDADCQLIGINDYCSVKGYKKLIDEMRRGSLDIGEKKLLPVVEFRMTNSVQNKHTSTNGATHFNFHIIFNDKVVLDEIEHFIRSLESDGTIIGGDYDNKEKLINKKVDFFKVIDRLHKDIKFKNNFLTWLPYDEYGGIDEINPDSDGWMKSEFIKKTDIIGSSNKKQIDFFSWISPIKKDGVAKFTQEEFFNWFGVKKPCIKGSDSHASSYPLGKLKNEHSEPIEKFCWLKAEPTFEGLKQIIYEPDRVKIQQENPENIKQSYHLIDKIVFNNAASNSLFSEKEIGLNPDLNSIIGGKSSGKSLLLQLIAKSVMPVERFNLLQDSGNFNLPKYDETLKDFDVEIYWKDGTVNRLSEAQKEENKKPVTYIPQMYLNYMAENKRSDFRELIESILIDKDGYKSFIENKEKEINSIEKNISSEILKYFEIKNKYLKLKDEIQLIGDSQAISVNIDFIKKDLDMLKKQSGLNDTQQQEYQKLTDQKNAFLTKKQKLETEVTLNQVLESGLNELSYQLNSIVEQRINALAFDYSGFDDKLNEAKRKFLDGITKTISDLVTDCSVFNTQVISASIAEIDKEIQAVDACILPLKDNLKNQELLKLKMQLLEQENKKIQQIAVKQKEIERLREALKSNQINSLYESLLKQYVAISAELKHYSQISSTIGKEIKLISEVKFNYESFNRDFLNYINKKRSLDYQFKDCNFIENLYEFSVDEHAEKFNKIAKIILNNGFVFNQNKPLTEMLSALFKNYFYIDYDLQQGNDRLGQMSPGKKGIILFQLFLHLSSSKWPILIDQPEDNLDNRSVYTELNNFIKEKKLERQIIMVSHNANLVVSTDSENIIVAHQNGNEPNRSRFEYINGALENSYTNKTASHIFEFQGIREHVCEILEGGITAFKQREKRYDFQ